MVTIKFQGWFECRLATDPDPTDELRGVSGYTRCLPGEPDFDRIIRCHNPKVNRSHTPMVGVYVTKIISKNTVLNKHPLIGAKFNLENEPKFNGYGGIIGDNGEEPIVPVIISIRKDNFQLLRSLKEEEVYPFDESKPTNKILMGGNDIVENTGIWDIDEVILQRISLLENDLKKISNEIERFNILERINFLRTRFAGMFFNVRVNWNLQLKGTINFENNTHINIFDNAPWILNFWMGGWDTDGLCGYLSGIVKMPKASIQD